MPTFFFVFINSTHSFFLLSSHHHFFSFNLSYITNLFQLLKCSLLLTCGQPDINRKDRFPRIKKEGSTPLNFLINSTIIFLYYLSRYLTNKASNIGRPFYDLRKIFNLKNLLFGNVLATPWLLLPRLILTPEKPLTVPYKRTFLSFFIFNNI